MAGLYTHYEPAYRHNYCSTLPEINFRTALLVPAPFHVRTVGTTGHPPRARVPYRAVGANHHRWLPATPAPAHVSPTGGAGAARGPDELPNSRTHVLRK